MPPGQVTSLVIPTYVIVAMFVGAANAKALAPTIAFVLGLMMVYPDVDKANFLFIFYIPAVLLAGFRG